MGNPFIPLRKGLHLLAWPAIRGCLSIVVLAAWSPLAAGADDLLILRDGSRRVGRLQICVDDRCTLNGQGTPREQIEWIGLQDPGTAPPAVRDSTDDEVHLRDRTVRSGALVGISAGVVLTERGSFEREDVAWIHLIAGNADLDGGRETAEEPSPPPSPPPLEDEDPQPTPSPTTNRPIRDPPPGKPMVDPPPSRPPGRPPARPRGDTSSGDLWIGHVHGDLRTAWNDAQGAGFHHYTTKLLVRLRETRRPVYDRDPTSRSGVRVVGYEMELRNEDTDVEAGYDNSMGCSGRATTRFSDDERTHGGWVIYRTVDEPVLRGFPGMGALEVPKEGLYWLTFLPQGQWNACSRSGSGGYDLGYGLHNDGVGIGDAEDVATQPAGRRLTQNRSRMTGSYTRVHPSPNMSSRLQVRWDICRAGSAGCTMAPPNFDGDPCGDLAKLRAQMDLLQDKRKALSSELDELWERFEKHQKEMEAHRGDFEQTMRDCKLWDTAMKLMEFLIKGGSGPGKALIKLKSIITKIQSGNPTWAIPDIEGDDVSLKALNLTWKYLKGELKQSGESDLQTMQRKLEKCAGSTPMTSYETYKNAQNFVDSFGKMAALLPEIQAKVDQIYQKDLELWNEQHEYYRDCLAWAQCKKLDPSVCDPRPPERAPR